MICLKNCTFVVSTTTEAYIILSNLQLWFAWKIVPLWYQQQQVFNKPFVSFCCDLLEKLYLCGINNNALLYQNQSSTLWFAWKIVPLWYQQQRFCVNLNQNHCCDLLEKLYLCGINNNKFSYLKLFQRVVICLKNCTFVVSTTTDFKPAGARFRLWFAWKIVPLWYQQQQIKTV